MEFTAIDKILADLRNGKPVIITDQSGGVRGCFVIPANRCDAKLLEKIIPFSSLPIKLAVTKEQLEKFDLPVMVDDPVQPSLTIKASRGIGMGDSTTEMNVTIQSAINLHAQPKDVVSPGNILLTSVIEGGCLVKPVFAESACDLVRLAGEGNFAVIAEITDEKGKFQNEVQLTHIAEKLALKIGSIHDLIEYRFRHEPLVQRINSVDLPTEYGNFRLHVYKASFDSSRGIDLALTFGRESFLPEDIPLVRVHSEWSIANIVNRLSFSEGSYLNRAMKKVSESGQVGAIIFLRNTPEQHTNALFEHPKKPTDIWFENGYLKTLSPMGQSMSYGFGAQILRDLGVKKMRLLAHKESQFSGIDKYGLEIVEQISF